MCQGDSFEPIDNRPGLRLNGTAAARVVRPVAAGAIPKAVNLTPGGLSGRDPPGLNTGGTRCARL